VYQPAGASAARTEIVYHADNNSYDHRARARRWRTRWRKKGGIIGGEGARASEQQKNIYIYTHIHMHTHIQVYRCALNPKSLLYPTFHSLHPCHPCRLFFRHKSESPVGPAGTERERDLSLVQRMRDKMHWELRISPRCSSK